MIFHVILSESFAKLTVRRFRAPAPTGQHFLCAGERPAVKVEIFLNKPCGECRGRRMDQMPPQIYFPVGGRSGDQRRINLLKKIRNVHVNRIYGRSSRLLEIPLPGEMRSELSQLGERHYVVELLRVSPL